MKKTIITLLVLAIVITIWHYPKHVISLGTATVTLDESVMVVAVNNWIGDQEGRNRCQITGVSSNWAKSRGYLAIEETRYTGREMVVSEPAIRVLEQLTDAGQVDEAYTHADVAFANLQINRWGTEPSEVLHLKRPLQDSMGNKLGRIWESI